MVLSESTAQSNLHEPFVGSIDAKNTPLGGHIDPAAVAYCDLNRHSVAVKETDLVDSTPHQSWQPG